jgi:hypothetical protein
LTLRERIKQLLPFGIIREVTRELNPGDRAVAERSKEKGLEPQRIDAGFELLKAKKVEEWKSKGYKPELIERALLWAEDWARGTAKRFIKDPELAARIAKSIYPEALELSERYIQEMAK